MIAGEASHPREAHNRDDTVVLNGRNPMPLNIRVDGDIVILSNFGRLMNDPRYVDASRDTSDLLEKGFTKFILDLGGFRETGSSFLGLLMTMTRRIRKYGGEAALAHLSPDTERFIDEMQMDDYWDIFKTVEEASRFFERGPD
jgi:anti-sigma B factor antagonist